LIDQKTGLERRRVEDMLAACPDAFEMLAMAGDELCRHAVLERCAMGSRLWTQGAPVAEVLVTQGPVCISSLNDKGDVNSGAILLCNSHLIGEAEVFARITSRPNEAMALAEQDIVRLPAHVFLACVEREPLLCQAWLRLSNQRFLAALQHSRLASIRSAEDRLQWAIALMISMGHVEPGGTVLLPDEFQL
jgi:CRP-like cAMP-binding protein